MQKLIRGLLYTVLCIIPLFACSQENNREKFIQSLVARMTLAEKAGQMTQLTVETILKTSDGRQVEPYEVDPGKLREAINTYKVGSILNVGGNAQPLRSWQKRLEDIQQAALKERLSIPVLYGVDAIRGNNYCSEAVMFPQQIALAATFDNALIKDVAKAAAYETRAAFVPWTFSPVLDLGRNAAWPRIWETFGEDPFLTAEMGKAMIAGYEGTETVVVRADNTAVKANGRPETDRQFAGVAKNRAGTPAPDGTAKMLGKYNVLACLKHFVGYSSPLSGHDRTPAWIPERELREYFLPSFEAAIRQGAKTIMVNSAEINGTPVHINKHILTDILKVELKYDGFLVSDWQDIKYLYQRHKVAKDNKEAIALAVNAGIDMSMVPDDYTFTRDLIELVKEGRISMKRIDDAVTRILRVKYYAGLFQAPLGSSADFPLFNSPEHNRLNYTAASESITLLKNQDDLLPLSTSKKILVTGPAAHSMRTLNGGWSRNWQGDNSDETEQDKNTIVEALRERFGDNLQYAEGAGFGEAMNLAEVTEKAKAADIIVLCLGENSYTENMGNINDLTLPAAQLELAQTVAGLGKPVVLVLTEGRPRIISAIEPLMPAIALAYVPGNEGGNAIADMLTGRINPGGKLPYTYPRLPNGLLNYYHKHTETTEFDPAGYNPQWEFGYGLSYTRFRYTNLRLSDKNLPASGKISVSVDLTNTGSLAGKEAVLMFISDEVASVTPEVKRLRGYKKVELLPGQTQTVSFEIDRELLSFINADLKRVTEAGDFRISIGELQERISVR